MYKQSNPSFPVGVTYNVSLLRDVLNHPKFRMGDITTKFLPLEYPSGFKGEAALFCLVFKVKTAAFI